MVHTCVRRGILSPQTMSHVACTVRSLHAWVQALRDRMHVSCMRTCTPAGRVQVMEKLNAAVEKLYESDRLPEDPMDFIAQQIAPKKAKGKP